MEERNALIAVGYRTTGKIFETIKQYVPDDKIRQKLLRDLSNIKGNASFKTTIDNIIRLNEIEARAKRGWKDEERI